MNASKHLSAIVLILVATCTFPEWALSQPPFRRGGDDDSGDRPGGFRGGGFRGRGGPPGGESGDEGGGFRGRGGGSRGRGGGRGGFDPSSMLRRLDRNGNGVLDPDEQEGPARFLIGRLQRDNPAIEQGKPIPLDKISEGFERMRRGRGDDDDDRRRGSDSDDLEIELLVPGFGTDTVPAPVLGFGPSAELLAVAVTEEDENDAARAMRRFDRDRDGMLSPQELSRFPGDPLDFDRNSDGRLSSRELAVRYARRREAEEEERSRRGNRDRNRWGRDGEDEPEEVPDPYGGANSFRIDGQAANEEGVPDWFFNKDTDGDRQVAMAEYTDRWTDDLVQEFFRFDTNSDGMITVSEVKQGVEAGVATSVASVRRERDSMSSASARSADQASSDRGATTPDKALGAEETVEVSDRMMKYAERIIGRYDTNKDGALTSSEWEGMLISPAPADRDGDARVTVEEYAAYFANRKPGR